MIIVLENHHAYVFHHVEELEMITRTKRPAKGRQKIDKINKIPSPTWQTIRHLGGVQAPDHALQRFARLND